MSYFNQDAPRQNTNPPITAGGRQRIFQASEKRIVENADGSSEAMIKQMQFQQVYQAQGSGCFSYGKSNEPDDAHRYEGSINLSFNLQRITQSSNGDRTINEQSFNTQDASNLIGRKLVSPNAIHHNDHRLSVAKNFFNYDGNALSQFSDKFQNLLE